MPESLLIPGGGDGDGGGVSVDTGAIVISGIFVVLAIAGMIVSCVTNKEGQHTAIGTILLSVRSGGVAVCAVVAWEVVRLGRLLAAINAIHPSTHAPQVYDVLTDYMFLFTLIKVNGEAETEGDFTTLVTVSVASIGGSFVGTGSMGGGVGPVSLRWILLLWPDRCHPDPVPTTVGPTQSTRC